MGKGSSFTQRHAVQDVFEVGGLWTGGGAAADCAVASGDHSRGITSIAYNAATGKYLVTFRDFGTKIVGFSFSPLAATGVNILTAALVKDTYSASAGTVELEVNAADGSTLTDIPSTTEFFISVKFSGNA